MQKIVLQSEDEMPSLAQEYLVLNIESVFLLELKH